MVNRCAAFDQGQLAAADGNHNFELIAVGKHLFGMATARHDFAVAFERDAFARKVKLRK
jgi:hypothetical protein